MEKTSGAIIVLLGFLIAMNATAISLRRRFERRWWSRSAEQTADAGAIAHQHAGATADEAAGRARADLGAAVKMRARGVDVFYGDKQAVSTSTSTSRATRSPR